MVAVDDWVLERYKRLQMNSRELKITLDLKIVYGGQEEARHDLRPEHNLPTAALLSWSRAPPPTPP